MPAPEVAKSATKHVFNVAGGASDPASIFSHASAFAPISIPAENEDRIRLKGASHCGQAVTGGSFIR